MAPLSKEALERLIIALTSEASGNEVVNSIEANNDETIDVTFTLPAGIGPQIFVVSKRGRVVTMQVPAAYTADAGTEGFYPPEVLPERFRPADGQIFVLQSLGGPIMFVVNANGTIQFENGFNFAPFVDNQEAFWNSAGVTWIVS